jgi:hypothetical protein
MRNWTLVREIRGSGVIVGYQYWDDYALDGEGAWIEEYPGTGLAHSRARKRRRVNGGKIVKYHTHPADGGVSEW